MTNPWKSKVLTFNRKRAEEGEKSEDLMTLLDALPPGQVKNLLKDETCAAILNKYGITGK
jgi:hypothetical protein